MDYSDHPKPSLENNNIDVKREQTSEKIVFVSLKDVPLETRRKEAKKPLFLTRYE